MGKVLGSWSGMRRYLEKEMLAECVQDRVRYNCTTYVGMDGCHIFEVYIDDHLIKQFSWETVNSFFIENHVLNDRDATQREKALPHYWGGFWDTLEKTPLSKRTEYTDEEFCEALTRYRRQSISESMTSEHPIERMFAVLDRRMGKRALSKLRTSLEEQPHWLQAFYQLRLEAEKLI